MSADGNRRGGESVSGGIKASFNVKKGKQTLVFAGRGFVCGCKWKRRESVSGGTNKSKQSMLP